MLLIFGINNLAGEAKNEKLESLLKELEEERRKEWERGNINLKPGIHKIKGYFISGAPDSILQICNLAETMTVKKNEMASELGKLGTGAKYIELTGEVILSDERFKRRLSFKILKIHKYKNRVVDECVWDTSRWTR